MIHWLTLLFLCLVIFVCSSHQQKTKPTNSQLNEESINFILKTTGAKRSDVIDYYKGFIRDFPNGKINKKEFKKLMKGYNQITDDRMDDFIKHSMNVYDTNKDGFVEFKEFYVKVWIESFGNLQQKIDLAFKFFDTNLDSYIDKLDIKKVFTSLSNANKPFGKSRGPEYKERMANIDFNTNKIVELSDINKDKKVSFAEFKNAATTHDFVRSRTIGALF